MTDADAVEDGRVIEGTTLADGGSGSSSDDDDDDDDGGLGADKKPWYSGGDDVVRMGCGSRTSYSLADDRRRGDEHEDEVRLEVLVADR